MKEKNFSHPEGDVLGVLKGDISEPVSTVSQKPGKVGEIVTTRVVREGSGMVGLKSLEDNKEWSGIFEHVLRTSRLSSFLASLLKAKGVEINPKTVLNTVLVSHCGRRQWDESRWYPDATKDADVKKEKSDTQISLELLNKAGVSPTIIRNVEAHAAGYPLEKLEKNWDAKVVLYADFRITQHVVSLKDRFDDFEKRAIPSGRITQEELNILKVFYQQVEEEIFYILKEIKPEEINDEYPKAPLWENYIRRLYINDAEENIFDEYRRMEDKLILADTQEEKEKIEIEMQKVFPENTWWGKYVRELYKKQGKKAYVPIRVNVQIGIDRAIESFK